MESNNTNFKQMKENPGKEMETEVWRNGSRLRALTAFPDDLASISSINHLQFQFQLIQSPLLTSVDTEYM